MSRRQKNPIWPTQQHLQTILAWGQAISALLPKTDGQPWQCQRVALHKHPDLDQSKLDTGWPAKLVHPSGAAFTLSPQLSHDALRVEVRAILKPDFYYMGFTHAVGPQTFAVCAAGAGTLTLPDENALQRAAKRIGKGCAAHVEKCTLAMAAVERERSRIGVLQARALELCKALPGLVQGSSSNTLRLSDCGFRTGLKDGEPHFHALTVHEHDPSPVRIDGLRDLTFEQAEQLLRLLASWRTYNPPDAGKQT